MLLFTCVCVYQTHALCLQVKYLMTELKALEESFSIVLSLEHRKGDVEEAIRKKTRHTQCGYGLLMRKLHLSILVNS